MGERLQTKQEELAFLAEEYRKHPELFVQRTFIEDAPALRKFGISIPDKEHFVAGTTKLWPEDFIVEEVAPDGTRYGVVGESASPPPTPPAEQSPTTYATLVKCGLSTLEAIEELSRGLGIKKEHIAFAGIKDKDALTSQRISLRHLPLEKLQTFSSPYFFLKDLSFGKGAVEKGKLRGNRFTILVRTDKKWLEDERSEKVISALASVRNKGFYNFFYLQRFGTPRLCNFQWAEEILKGNYEQAVRDILSTATERELPFFAELRKELGKEFGNWQKLQEMLAPFPILFSHERKLVGHLALHHGDFVGALQTIPEQITLWLYALASLLFNKKISEYLARGQEPPRELPFFLSPDRHDHEPYRQMLEAKGLYPVPFQNVRPFPQVQVRHRMTATKDHGDILKGEIVPEGLILEFELSKGQYATTLLSHIFNLTSGKPPEDISKERLDTKKILGELPLGETLTHFENIIASKGENAFENLIAKNE